MPMYIMNDREEERIRGAAVHPKEYEQNYPRLSSFTRPGFERDTFMANVRGEISGVNLQPGWARVPSSCRGFGVQVQADNASPGV